MDISEQEIRERCSTVISYAVDEAERTRHNFIGVEHIFNALSKLEGSLTQHLITEAGLEARTVRGDIRRESMPGDEHPSETPPLTPRCYRVLAMAIEYADNAGQDLVQEEQVLLAILRESHSIPARKLITMGVDLERWITKIEEKLPVRSTFAEAEADYSMLDLSIDTLDKLRESVVTTATPLLDKYGRDLTELAKLGKLTPAIGREREIRAVARTLTRIKKNNPLLLGDAGVGKTAVIEGLAVNIVQGSAPASLLHKRIIQLEIGMLIAGTSLRGQFEERLMSMVDEARKNGDIILFIDEIHTIVGAGDTVDSNLDAANILKPALSRGEIVCIGATTHEEYRRAIATDAALDRRFRIIDINEPSADETLQILQNIQTKLMQHHGVQITPETLQAAVQLSSKYMINRRQPDKSLDLLDEACARLVIQTQALDPAQVRVVTPDVVAEVVAEWTGIPINELTENQRRKYAHIDAELRNYVAGQDHAIQAVSDAIRTNQAGLTDPTRPVGVFLFLGPSGVGKTELAKALAKCLFGNESALLRFDMSEFHDEHTIARLIGSPPGYRDSQRGGQLTEALRRKPYSVVLLDEVEKAAPEVFDIFLQVFDDGRLTDSRGGPIDARYAVWIMTSNIGTAELGRGNIGFTISPDELHHPDYQRVLRKFFRPEFLNRLDEIVIFNQLTTPVLNQILDMHLEDLYRRLKYRNLKLELTPEAREMILAQGYDPANGARPIRRTVERLIVRPLSQRLLESDFAPGQVLVAKVEDGKLHIVVEPPPATLPK